MNIKFFETHYEEYIHSNNENSLHPKIEKNILHKLPSTISLFKNIILYGPVGIGKYTQSLHIIKKYSPSELKYEKKISIVLNGKPYHIKISDIHYEIDMSILGCNPKVLWNDIYLHIVDIVSSKTEKYGIILCKNFNGTQTELLDNFYSYIQQDKYSLVDIKFIILTEQLSFIPENILKACYIIRYPKPSQKTYLKIIKDKKIEIEYPIKNITDIKACYSNIENINHYDNVCNKIINEMLNIEHFDFMKFRDMIYEIFIYNLDINICIWNILNVLLSENKINDNNLSIIMIKTYQFFRYYNNNYRPLSHVEKYFLHIMTYIQK